MTIATPADAQPPPQSTKQSQPLFDDIVPVELSHESRDPVLLSVQLRWPGDAASAGNSAASHARLQLRLTRPDDPRFLWLLDLDAADDFGRLKTEQNLLIDFGQLPEMICQLLRQCGQVQGNNSHGNNSLGNNIQNSSQSSHEGRFRARLAINAANGNAALFSLVELNAFRQITHLQLPVHMATHPQLVQHLCQLTQANEQLAAQYRLQWEQTVQRLEESDRSRMQLQVELDAAKLSVAREQSMGKQVLERERGQWETGHQLAMEQLRRQLVDEHERVVAGLRLELTQVKEESARLLQDGQLSGSQVTELRHRLAETERQLETVRGEYQRSSGELASLKTAHELLQHQHGEMRSRLGDQERQVAMAQQSVSDKELMLTKLEQIVQSHTQQTMKLEESVQLYRSRHEQSQEQLAQLDKDVNKANEIIRKLQQENKVFKQKLKLKNTVTLQQEKLVEEKQSLYEQVMREVSELKEVLVKKETELMDARRTLEERQRDVDGLKKQLDENKNVIDWLHKQLNEEAIGHNGSAGGHHHLSGGGLFAKRGAQSVPNVAATGPTANAQPYSMAKLSSSLSAAPLTGGAATARYQKPPTGASSVMQRLQQPPMHQQQQHQSSQSLRASASTNTIGNVGVGAPGNSVTAADPFLVKTAPSYHHQSMSNSNNNLNYHGVNQQGSRFSVSVATGSSQFQQQTLGDGKPPAVINPPTSLSTSQQQHQQQQQQSASSSALTTATGTPSLPAYTHRQPAHLDGGNSSVAGTMGSTGGMAMQSQQPIMSSANPTTGYDHHPAHSVHRSQIPVPAAMSSNHNNGVTETGHLMDHAANNVQRPSSYF